MCVTGGNMIDNLNFSGIIFDPPFSDGKFSYYFDGSKLNLIKIEDLNFIEIHSSQNNFNILETKLSRGGNVVFFDCVQRFRDFLSTDNVIVPLYLFKSRFEDKAFSTFKKLVFTSNFINQLFPPTQIVAYDSDNYYHNADLLTKKWDGPKKIILKKSLDVNKSFDINLNEIDTKVKISFNITTSGAIYKSDENLGEISSNFTISFDDPLPINKIKDIYLIVKKFFQFLTNRLDINFEDIEVRDDTQTIGYFYDLVHDTNEKIPFVCPVNFYFNSISKLFEYIGNSNVNLNHIPRNEIENTHLTYNQYINCSGALESNSQGILGKDKDIAADFVIEKITEISTSFNQKQRRFCDKILSTIENEKISIEQLYNRAQKKFASIVEPIINELSDRYKIAKEPNRLGKIFAESRHIGAHGVMKPLTNNAGCSFIIARTLVDCLILYKCKYAENDIYMIIINRYQNIVDYKTLTKNNSYYLP